MEKCKEQKTFRLLGNHCITCVYGYIPNGIEELDNTKMLRAVHPLFLFISLLPYYDLLKCFWFLCFHCQFPEISLSR